VTCAASRVGVFRLRKLVSAPFTFGDCSTAFSCSIGPLAFRARTDAKTLEYIVAAAASPRVDSGDKNRLDLSALTSNEDSFGSRAAMLWHFRQLPK
jgi:hypothetical protein